MAIKIPENTLPIRDVLNDDYVRVVGQDGKSYRVPKSGFAGDITIDDELSTTSENPVQNKVITNALNNKADIIITSASGSIAHIEDAGAYPLVGMKVYIEPVQEGSGDPSPENVRPISGHTGCEVYGTGVNVWDEQWELGGISVDGATSPDNSKIRSKNYIGIIPGKTYYCTSGNPVVYAIFFDRNHTSVSASYTAIANKAFTVPSDAYYMKIRVGDNSNPITTYNNDISINYPSTDTAYNAYHGSTIPITWQTEAGTVYGIELKIFEDGSCDLTADRRCITVGQESVSKVENSNYATFQIVPSSANKAKNEANTIICLSSAFKGVSFNGASATGDNYLFSSGGNIRIKNTGNANLSADGWKALMTNVQICYYLATPIVYHLDPVQTFTLLKGVNNVWNDANGDTEVTYKADTKLFIEKAIAEAVAAL